MSIAARCRGLLLVLSLLSLSSRADEAIVVLAESGLVTPPFVISNGCLCQAVSVASSEKGRAVYNFTVTNAGSFVVQALVNSPYDQTNSLLVNLDAEPEPPTMIWDVPLTVGFTNQLVSWHTEAASGPSFLRRKVFNLARGEHQLIIRGGWGRVQLARITILALPPPPTGLHLLTQPGR